ncbi:hypothetical protein [Aeromonas enteropelogenes]|uniref:hypothetical protein n=1 Tax=Aeromonas enteropelogenes TaxID=29489 RepID=UPI003BA19B93
MKFKKWLENWDLTSLKITAPFMEMEWSPQDEDKEAAWEMYIELLTRITTQSLAPEDGDEKAALDSIYSLFPITREIIKRKGRHCIEFTKIAIVVLNQIVRPFTAKWHKKSINGDFSDPKTNEEFRQELSALQQILVRYTQMLASMAEVEDLTKFEK